MPTSQYDALVEVAADNHGLFDAVDAANAGVAGATLHRWRAAGRIERVSHGLYRMSALPVDRLSTYMEAVAWTGNRGAISHASTLEMMELCDIIPRRIHITVPAGYNPRKAGGDGYRVHRYTLPAAQLTYYEGVPTVTVPRAIHQAIRIGEDPEQLRTAVRSAFRQGIIGRSTAAQLRAALR